MCRPALNKLAASFLFALGLAVLPACGGEVSCETSCNGSATVVRNFPSCSALRDEHKRRSDADQLSECEDQALSACEERYCATSPL